MDDSGYPFYGLWNKHTVFNGASLYVHPKQTVYIYGEPGGELILIGHAYDPFEMESDENRILAGLYDQLNAGRDGFFSAVNRLTGTFMLIWRRGGKISFLGDPTGKQTCFYTLRNGKYCVGTHSYMIGSIMGLERDPYIEKLIGYRFFGLMGNLLPGDLTLFSDVKRLIPNHLVSIGDDRIEVERFYLPHGRDIPLKQIIEESAEIMHNNLWLISEKWKKPAISMTGGCDSKTTLAAAKGLYDKFTYFSYISNESERVDAEAAHGICGALGLPHIIYRIPDGDGEVADFAEVRTILRYNHGNIGNSNSNDVRKRIFLDETPDFDVEVKSWSSELVRASYSKRFNGRTNFGDRPTPRACTTLYKFFLHNRRLVRQTDKVFEEFLDKYYIAAEERPLAWWEQFYWEYYQGALGLKITGEHLYSFDITIPYNNRILQEIMMSAPLEDRVNDRIHIGIRDLMNPDIDATGIAVTNLKHTKNRERMENLYYAIHSKLPF